MDELRPYVGNAYATVARGASSDDAGLEYQPSFEIGDLTDRAALGDRILEELERRRPTSSTVACPWWARTATSWP